MTKKKDSHKCNILLQYTIFIGIINMVFRIKPAGKVPFPCPEEDGGTHSGTGIGLMETAAPGRREKLAGSDHGKM